MTEYQKKLNYNGATLLLALLEGKITKEEAFGALPQKKKKCIVGANGICTVHGNPIEECKNER